MHHFFVDPQNVGEREIVVTGSDVNHMKNVLRLRVGEEILLSDGAGNDYLCAVAELSQDQVIASIVEHRETRELPAKIWLFQGLPKSDKMEMIIQKAVELGAWAIVPVATKNAVVRLDAKKEENKLRRWQAIAESAAKQSKRGVIPTIEGVCTFAKAVEQCKDFDLSLIAYENERGMEATKEAFSSSATAKNIAVFIGPEGGFDSAEVELAKKAGVIPVSLGARILRTETAGPAMLSALMLRLEGGI